MTKKTEKKENKKPVTESIPNDENPVTVVGIGASAGGLEALQELFTNMPVDTGLCFVVIQHLSPDYKSLMGELLARFTTMKIFKGTDGLEVIPNSVYLIPPGKNMTIFHRKLYLSDVNYSQGLNLPIDRFFQSLAKDLGKSSIAIILSGTGSDGTLGIRAIKEAGGMVMVQDDRSAKFNGMPRSSISTGMVDYILPPSKMPEELLNYIKHPFFKKEIGLEEVIGSKADDFLSKILLLLREHSKVDFTYYKESTILRRIEKRMSINQIEKTDDYLRFVERKNTELEILYKELLIGVTRFFRDEEAFIDLKEKIFPELVSNNGKQETIRIWTVGCSTGEEAYSLAMLLHEFMEQNNQKTEVKIFASDIDKESVEFAAGGFYPESIISDISPQRLGKFFIRRENGYQIAEFIRRMIIFAPHNVLADPPFSKLDMISCRNMLIYLKNEAQEKVLSTFYYSLRKNGYLFLGSSETLGSLSNGFSTISSKYKIYKFKSGFRYQHEHVLPIPTAMDSSLVTNSLRITSQRFSKRKASDYFVDEILDQLLPPSVIISEQYEILHIIGDVNPFLKLPAGRLQMNLIKMLPQEISMILSGMLRKASTEGKPALIEKIRSESREGPFLFNLFIRLIRGKNTEQESYLVSFEKIESRIIENEIPHRIDFSEQYSERLTELERELQFTRENLQATVEELETSNEELQSSNEELIASNEELQSTNQELQSVNEELYTVNSEYQNKIEELSQLHNDMNNLLNYTKIGTLFLDRKLMIRKITPVATSITHIQEGDIGRPIQHISLTHLKSDFQQEIRNVYSQLHASEFEIMAPNDAPYLVRILPYRTEENAVEGIIITFFNVTELKKTKAQLEHEKEFLISVLNNSPLGKTMLDENGKIIYINKAAGEIFGLSQQEMENRAFNDIRWKITGLDGKEIPAEKLPFALVMKNKKPIFHYRHYIERPGGKPVLLCINGAPRFNGEGQVNGAVFTIEEENHKENL